MTNSVGNNIGYIKPYFLLSMSRSDRPELRELWSMFCNLVEKHRNHLMSHLNYSDVNITIEDIVDRFQKKWYIPRGVTSCYIIEQILGDEMHMDKDIFIFRQKMSDNLNNYRKHKIEHTNAQIESIQSPDTKKLYHKTEDLITPWVNLDTKESAPETWTYRRHSRTTSVDWKSFLIKDPHSQPITRVYSFEEIEQKIDQHINDNKWSYRWSQLNYTKDNSPKFYHGEGKIGKRYQWWRSKKN